MQGQGSLEESASVAYLQSRQSGEGGGVICAATAGYDKQYPGGSRETPLTQADPSHRHNAASGDT